jgi:voltage-gated potassium channel
VRTLLSVVKSIRAEVGVTFFTSIIAIVLAGILMYYAENDAQPEAFADMGRSIWWAVATLTTVGYGDIYPITIMGKIIATSLAFIGVGLIAIPAGLISAAYVEEVYSIKGKKKK